MTRVLVTGGSGFVGSHIVDALLAAGMEPVVFDRRDPRETLVIDGDVEYIAGDICDLERVLRAARGADLVCHQAAMVGLGVDLDDLPRYAADNDLGTAVLLRALARTRPARVVLASSMVVYGEGRYRCAVHGVVPAPPRSRRDLEAGRFEPVCSECDVALLPEPVGENAPVDPRNVYAATKLHQEHLASAFSRETGIPVTALRYHNVYGPRMPRETPYAGVAALFTDALAAGRSPRVFEDGHQLRDFVHVRDVARANLLALAVSPAVNGPVNVCSGRPRSVGELALALAAAFGEGAPEPRVTGEFRMGDVRHVFADATRAQEMLGFEAAEDFDACIAELAGDLAGDLNRDPAGDLVAGAAVAREAAL